MNNSDNNPLQPGNPYGFLQNQMMQQLLSSLQMSQMGGMQLNGSGAPVMQPNLHMYLNPYQAMGGGMPQQFFNPMQFGAMNPQFGGQMPMMPPMDSPIPPMHGQISLMGGMPPHMGGQLLPMGGHMHPMGGQMPSMLPTGHTPLIQYVPVYMMPFPANAPMPAPIPIKKEMPDDDDSVIECTPPSISKANFSIANILNQREVKNEPIDEEDLSIPNTTTNGGLERPIKTSDSPIRPEKFLLDPPVPSINREEIPDTPASPDRQFDDQLRERGDSSREEQQETIVGCDEYLSSDETMENGAEGALVICPPPSRWERDSTREKSPLYSSSTHTPDRLIIDELSESTFTIEETSIMDESKDVKISLDGVNETKEESTVEVGMRKEETVDGCQLNSRQEANESTPLFHMNIRSYESPILRPSIPKRFPVRRSESIGEEDRREKLKEEIRSPWRSTKSPVRRRDDRGDSPKRKRRRVNAYSVLASVPPRMEDYRIERFFDERYGRCRVTRVDGDPSTVRIEFNFRSDRDHAFSHRNVFVGSQKLTIHEDVASERSESKEEAGPSRSSSRPSPIRVPSTEDMEKEIPFQLERYQRECEKGFPRKENLLTAGPIPKECNLMNVIKYFRREATVFDVPYPSHRSNEYLILRFSDIQDAKRIVAAREHIVDGHLIPVSPPYDVHLQLNGMNGLEEEAMIRIQDECGVLANRPIVHRGHTTYKGILNMFGYVTFGRPQDAQEAIALGSFSVEGRTFRVAHSDRNYSFTPYKELWEAKCKLADMSRKEKKRKRKEKENSLKDALITDYHMPILTIGPIPDNCLKECDKYLLSNFKEVYEIPFEMEDRNFRILTIDDSDLVMEMLKDGYLRVGEKEERVLISPSFDVVFKSANSASLDMKQMVPYLQRKYGPIVRRPQMKHFKAKLTFGRVKDALKAIEDSPHFKSMAIIAESAVPNISFQHFQKNLDLQLHLERANEADRMEEAANIRVDCRMNQEDAIKGKRRDSGLGGNSSVSIDEEEENDNEALVCSPVQKNVKSEEMSVIVRVTDSAQWLPQKGALLNYFQQFGEVASFTYNGHLEGVVQFKDLHQVMKVLKARHAKIGDVWMSILPYSLTANQ